MKDRKPTALLMAECAQRILNGSSGRWDEHWNPKDQRLKDLWLRTMSFGLPETWYYLDQARKGELRCIIDAIWEPMSGDRDRSVPPA